MRIIVAFVEALFAGSVLAQTLTPAADSGVSLFVVFAAGIAALAVGFALGRYVARNPNAVPKAEQDLLELLRKAHETISTLAAKVEHNPAAQPPAPTMTPEQVAAAKAAVAHLQEQIAQAERP